MLMNRLVANYINFISRNNNNNNLFLDLNLLYIKNKRSPFSFSVSQHR